MQLKMFTIPIKNVIEAEAEMNGFLRGHRVLAVKKERNIEHRTSNIEHRIKKPTHMNPINPHRNAPCIGFVLLLLAATAMAGPRASTNYSIATDSTDGGGQRIASAAYTHDGSLGGITGISAVAAPAETAKAGYLGQLTEVAALQLAAAPTTVNETSTRQLSAAELLDDDTLHLLAATAVTWSVASGPLAGIDTNGVATAATV